MERALKNLKTTQVQKFCGVFSSEGQLGLGVPNFRIVRRPYVNFSPIMEGNFILWKVTSSVRPLDTSINQNVGVTLVAISINSVILVMLSVPQALATTFFFKGPKPSFFYLGYLSSSIFFNYIAKVQASSISSRAAVVGLCTSQLPTLQNTPPSP